MVFGDLLEAIDYILSCRLMMRIHNGSGGLQHVYALDFSGIDLRNTVLLFSLRQLDSRVPYCQH